tara:strand:- start:495 stop:776 length:282 start_codon:yes stop_codon:yes gene_type:complete
MNRQQRRLLEKKIGAKTTKDLGDQISLFHKLPDLCSSCQEPFDKMNADMVKSWNVMVKQEVVRLFCPDCVSKANAVVDDFIEKNGLGDNNGKQ